MQYSLNKDHLHHKFIAEQREVLRKEPRIIQDQLLALPGNFRPGLLPLMQTYLQNGTVELPRNQTSELHFNKYPDTLPVFEDQLKNSKYALVQVVNGGGQVSGRSHDVAVN